MAQPSTELTKLRDAISDVLDKVAIMKARCDEVRSCARSRGMDLAEWFKAAIYSDPDQKIPQGDLQTPEEAVAGVDCAEKLATIAANDLDALNWMRNR